MINFRYHVVSLTAVFLALAIGLVVGTAALNGPVADSLSDNVNALRKDNRQLRETVSSLQEEATREEEFATEAAPVMLTGKLTGRRIVVVTTPTGDDQADGVVEMLELAGATVTGRIDIEDKFVNPENDVDLLDLADQASQPSIPSTSLPNNVEGVETASALLGSGLFVRPAGETAVNPLDLQALLTAYASAGFISIKDDKVSGPAEAVVVVSGPPHTDRDSAQKDEAVVTLVAQLDNFGPVIVSGSWGGNGNLVGAVRGDPALSKTISTVDNGNTTWGQVVTSLAVVEQLIDEKAGQYGLNAGAADLMPKPKE